MGAIIKLKIKKKKGIILRKLDNELLLYDKKRDMMHYLNKTASFVWEKINGKRTILDISKEMQQHYGLQSNIAIKDVKKTIGNFTKQKLLE